MRNAYIFLLIIAVLIVLGVGLIVGKFKTSPELPPPDPEPLVEEEIVVEPSAGETLIGANFIVPGSEVAVSLGDGLVDYEAEEGSSDGVVIFITEQAVRLEVEGTHYIVAPVAASTGGTGTFLYLVLYEESGSGNWRQLDDVLLGDRVVLQSLVARGSQGAEATILTRGEGEAFSAPPSVAEVKNYRVVAGSLLEFNLDSETGDGE